MTRTLSLLALAALTACASDFAAQCDGLTDKDEQLACLDAGFQSLRLDQAECQGIDEATRADDCYTVCSERGASDEECRLACDTRDEERPQDTREESRARTDRDGRSDERSREDLDRLHLDTREDVDRSDRSAHRERTIRDGLREGERLARCER